ncbi:MAG TPA: hypothetical protein VKK61_02340 [Tepidisphaeraceae bacterium]|nr:hypothetical protein [Tepidisphaeraceae bacterium]
MRDVEEAHPVPPIFLTAIYLSLLLALLLTHSMFKRLDHDEHQFISSGALLARHALIPYRDYPYFHMPYLVAIYAALFHATDHLLLAARLFSTACAFLIVLLVELFIIDLLKPLKYRTRLLIQTTVLIILIGNPLFIVTSGRSWNHDLPTLLTLLAFLMICFGLRNKNSTSWRFISAGALMGLAVGTRLTFAPAAVILPLSLLCINGIDKQNRGRLAGYFLFGLIAALLPVGFLFMMAPHQFIFGNFKYPFYNTLYRSTEHFATAMNLLGKAAFVLIGLFSQPATLVLTTLCIASTITMTRLIKWRSQQMVELQLLFALIAGLLIGTFAPTPLYLQYFYTPMVFMILTAAYGMAISPVKTKWIAGFIITALLSLPYVATNYYPIWRLFSFHNWIPVQVHETGQRIVASAGHGRVLTLAPIFALEGHAEIYPELSTGPFAWRIAPFVPESEEHALDTLDTDDLDTALSDRPPAIVLVGVEAELDKPLLAYATRHALPVVQINHSTEMAARAGASQ